MTKVLRILNRFNLGGPTFNVTYLTRYLPDEYETILIGGEPEEGETDSLHILEEVGIKPIILPALKRKPNLFDDIRAYRSIRKLIREHQPEIIHTHAAKAGALGRLAAIHEKVPVIVHTFHGHVFDGYFSPLVTKVFIQIERWLAKRSTAIVAISEEQKNDLVVRYKIASDEKVKIVQLGFDLRKFQENREEKRSGIREKYKLDNDTVAIAIVGRLAPIKNHEMFLSVMKVIAEKTRKNVHAFIVGDGLEKEKLEILAKEIPNTERFSITFTSWVMDISTFNCGMDIMCLTSLNEGTPVSLIEAQACNLPIISTNVGGVASVFQDGETGYLVESENVDAFAEKLLDLIENEEKRQKMSQNGWTYVRDKYDYKTLVANMNDLYGELRKKQK
jgi:glycosyltransferase involved in cell wall biosynthesis